MKPPVQDLDARRLASSAAPSWYVLMRSKDLGRRPVASSGRGEDLVVWRGRTGRPVAIDRYCPHHGADLALGGVQGGELRCVFHGWRFNEQGTCVAVPGETRIPGSAHRRLRRVEERYGLVWLWSGTDTPLFPLPSVPELDGTAPGTAAGIYRFSYRQNLYNTPVSRTLENGVDTVHFSELHRRAFKSIDVTVLEEPCWDADDPRRPAHADVGAWFGDVLEFELKQHDLIRRAARALGAPLGSIRIVMDHWPSGAVIRVFSDGRLRNTVVGTASPYGQGSGSGYGISITPRYGARVRDLTSHILMSSANRRAEREDRRVWRTLGTSYDGVLVKSDAPIMAYRRWYAGWVKSSLDTPSSRRRKTPTVGAQHEPQPHDR